jgi:hypothetical protein
MATTRPLWHDQQIAARVRAHMPDESPIDLEAHAAFIGKVVAEAEVARIASSVRVDAVRLLEAEITARATQPSFHSKEAE